LVVNHVSGGRRGEKENFEMQERIEACVIILFLLVSKRRENEPLEQGTQHPRVSASTKGGTLDAAIAIKSGEGEGGVKLTNTKDRTPPKKSGTNLKSAEVRRLPQVVTSFGGSQPWGAAFAILLERGKQP